MLFIAPIALTILEIATTGRASVVRIALQPFKNPIVIASLVGVLIAVTNLSIPTAVLEPFRLVGAAAVPAVLIGFGISLHGERVLKPGSHRQDVILATGIKLLVMPLVASGVGTLLNFDPPVLRAVVVMAALPVAQNVFNYAQRYNRSTILARDAIFLTTLGSVPILILASTLLA